MANLSNINDKFLVTTGGNVLIGQTAAVGTSKLQVTGNSTFAGSVATQVDSNGVSLRLLTGGLISWMTNGSSQYNTMSISGNDNTHLMTFRTNGADALVIDASQNVSPRENLRILNNKKATFGNGNDLQIYHDGTDSKIENDSASNLKILSNNILFKSFDDSEALAQFTRNGSVRLYYDNVQKFATTSTGISVSDTVIGTTARFDTLNNNANSKNIIYRNSSSTNTVVGGGSSPDKIYIQDNGDVGIGTSLPGRKLEIKDEITTNGHIQGLRIMGNASNYYDIGRMVSGPLSIQGSQAGYNDIVLAPTSGDVGIGTGTPSAKLEVVTAVGGDAIRLNFGQSADIFLGFNSANPRILLQDNSNVVTHNFQSNGDNYIVGSNVGIGTTSPDTRLHVVGPGGAVNPPSYSVFDVTIENSGQSDLGIIGTTYSGIYFGDAASALEGALVYYHGDNHMSFRTNGNNEKMRITSGGTVGNTGSTVLGGGAAEGVTGWNFAPGNGTIITSSDSDSNMYIGKVSGYSNDRFISFYVNGSLVGRITTNGSTTSYVTTSDYRAKENVVEMTGALDRVSQLKPSRFNFIADADKTVDGFLAHEVQEIVPEAISGEKDAVDEEGNPDYQGIDQSKLVPLLVAAIQELKAEIELLKSK